MYFRQRVLSLVGSSWLAVIVYGCTAQGWPRQLNFTSPPNPYATQTQPPLTAPAAPATGAREQTLPAGTQAKAHKRKRAAKKVAAKTTAQPAEDTETTDTQAEPEDHQKTAPAVTLVGGAADQKRAQKIVQNATERLSKIDRNNLKGENVAEYDQIQGFVNAARHALDEQNYELAFALARKAESLTDQLNQKSP